MPKRAIVLGIGSIAFLLSASAAADDFQPTTLEELQEFYPSVPDAANAAFVHMRAAKKIVRDDSSEELPFIENSDTLPVMYESLDPRLKEAIVAYLKKNAMALRLAHKASSMPSCRYPLDLTRATELELPHLFDTMRLGRLLALQAMNAADDNNPELAAQAIVDTIAVAQSLRNEPLVQSQEIRRLIWGRALDSLERAVNRIRFRQQLLLRFQKSVTKANDREPMARAFQGELCIWMNVKIQTEEEFEAQVKAFSWDRMTLTPKLKQEFVEEARRLIEESRLPYFDFARLFPSAWGPGAGSISQDTREDKEGTEVRHFFAFRPAMAKAANLAARASAARGAMAAERYRLKFGKFPERWEDMVPDFLDAPILDPFLKDTPLILRVSEDGCIVYSVGQNGKNDGGVEGDGRPPLDHVFRLRHRVSAAE